MIVMKRYLVGKTEQGYIACVKNVYAMEYTEDINKAVLFPYDMTFEEYESWCEFFVDTEFILYWR